MTAATSPSAPAIEAIEAGIAALPGMGVDPEAYRLVGVRNELAGRQPEPFRWRLDFKIASTIPDASGGMLGKGGDLSVLVDLSDGSVKRLRGGD